MQRGRQGQKPHPTWLQPTQNLHVAVIKVKTGCSLIRKGKLLQIAKQWISKRTLMTYCQFLKHSKNITFWTNFSPLLIYHFGSGSACSSTSAMLFSESNNFQSFQYFWNRRIRDNSLIDNQSWPFWWNLIASMKLQAWWCSLKLYFWPNR